jgi:hypothetical protein
MTQSNTAEKTVERCAGELLWNVSLLPISPGPRPWSAPLAPIVELALPESAEAKRHRNAA